MVAISARKAGGVRAAARTNQPLLQITRGLVLAAEICIAVYGFTLLGLVESHAVFACYPLLVAALSGPILGEKVGWRRWAAIAVGFVGVLIILNPGYTVFAVSGGEEAVAYLKENSVDLVILDMIMDPGIDGLDTYKRIVAGHPGQKAIVASGFSETERVKEVQRLGAKLYIKKPYTIEKIGLAVKEAL